MAGSTNVSASGQQDIDGLLSGVKWDTSSITYSFPASAAAYEYSDREPANGFAPVTPQMITATREITNWFSSVANVTFTELGGTTAAGAIIRLAKTDYDTPDGKHDTAWAFHPSDIGRGGDIWFRNLTPENFPAYDSPQKGNYAYQVIAHEIGHALGLKHGHEGAMLLPANHDSFEYSIMTYHNYVGHDLSDPLTKGDTALEGSRPQSLMQDDIAALQYMYGANFTHNNGDTNYAWTPTGEMFVDGVGQIASTQNKVFVTVWDGGGFDTYDLSNYTTGVRINLNPGEWSLTSFEQLAELQAAGVDIPRQTAQGNIANALLYQGNLASVIEAAKGGAAGDFIIGNIVDNHLYGNAGIDNIKGGDGGDFIWGGADGDNLFGEAGIDWIYGEDDDDTIFGGRDGDRVFGGDGSDLIFGDDAVDAIGATDLLYGETGDDTLNGGAGSDRLYGGDGDDVLNGDDSDFLVGGLGGDVITGGFASYGSAGLLTAGSVGLTGHVAAAAVSGIALDLRLTGIRQGTGGAGDDILTGVRELAGSIFDDTLIGADTASQLYGGLGADTLIGLEADDTLVGDDLDAWFAHTGGDDALFGGGGNDLIFSDFGINLLVGGDGIDTVTYTAWTPGAGQPPANGTLGIRGVNVDLGAGTYDVAPGAQLVWRDTVEFVENVIGSWGDDVIRGDSGVNAIDGSVGDDRIDGGGGLDELSGSLGRDTVVYTGENDGVDVNLATGLVFFSSTPGAESISFFENVEGSSFSDVLKGDDNDNQLLGGGGDDQLWGYGGFDGAVYLQSRSSYEILESPLATGAYTIRDLLTESGLDEGTDIAFEIEYFRFSDFSVSAADLFDPTFAGTASADTLEGAADGGLLFGYEGDDFLTGGSAGDLLSGGLGDDATRGGAGNDSYVFNTGDGNDLIEETSGFDTLQLGDGIFLGEFVFARDGDNLHIDIGSGVTIKDFFLDDLHKVEQILFYSGTTFDLGSLILDAEHAPEAAADLIDTDEDSVVAGSLFADNGFGSDTDANGDDFFVAAINGLAANVGATIVLASGAQLLVSADGTFQYDPNGRFEALLGGESATDTFEYTLSDGSLTSEGAVATIAIAGVDDPAPPIIGTNRADMLSGTSQSDAIEGRRGADMIAGRGGNDTIQGNEGDDVASGDDGDDVVTGDNGNDRVSGGLGDDMVLGGAGDDRVKGDGGNDILYGDSGSDSVHGGLGNDTASGGDGADMLNGDEGDDSLFGNAGRDALSGGQGDDALDGGRGHDVLAGGQGADKFMFGPDWGNDIVSDFQSGVDKIQIIDDSVVSLDAIQIRSTAQGTTIKYLDNTIVIKGAGFRVSDLEIVDQGSVDGAVSGSGVGTMPFASPEDSFVFSAASKPVAASDFTHESDIFDLVASGTRGGQASWHGAGRSNPLSNSWEGTERDGVSMCMPAIDANTTVDFLPKLWEAKGHELFATDFFL